MRWLCCPLSCLPDYSATTANACRPIYRLGETGNFDNAFQGPTSAFGLAMSMYFVLRAYSGWTQLNIVVGELQEPEK